MKNSKFKIFLLFGAVFLFFIAYGYWQAVDREDQESQGPKILVEPREFDFGQVEFGKVVEFSFKIKNIGSEPLEIKRVSTSCACTKARVEKKSLKAGEKTKLLVSYDAGAMGKRIVGKRIRRFVYIKSNDPKNPQIEVAIYASVK